MKLRNMKIRKSPKRKILPIISLLLCLVCITSCKDRLYSVGKGPSMIPGLLPGDFVYIEKATKYDYGDIVVFDNNDGYRSIFRVAGIPADTIGMDDYICIINGKKNGYNMIGRRELDIGSRYPFEVKILKEEFPNGNKYEIYIELNIDWSNIEIIDSFNPLCIPENSYFVLGDFRNSAKDSRFRGMIPYEKIKGKVIKITLLTD